jgi:ABC-type uncharacterized transport system permease subunit
VTFSRHATTISLAVVIGLAVGAGAIAAAGHDPLASYQTLAESAFGSYSAFANSLRVATPVILAGLAFAIGFRAGAFNAGIQGQFFLGAVVAAWVGVKADFLPTALHIALLFIAAGAAGLAWAVVPIIMRIYLSTNEIIPTFMLNYVALLLGQYIVVERFREPAFSGITSGTPEIADSAKLLQIMPPHRVTVALPLIAALGIGIAFYLRATASGYELRMTGRSQPFAQYGGVQTRRVWATAMATSATLAGITGAVVVSGDQHRAVAEMFPNLMFDGIVASLMALNSTIGILFTGVFLGALNNAGLGLQLGSQIPLELVTVISGAIILFATAKRWPMPAWTSRRQRGRKGDPGPRDPRPSSRAGDDARAAPLEGT